MGLKHLFLAFFAAAVLAANASALAQPVRTANVEAQLHSARAAIAPGERFTIVLRQTIREHWHTYWVNPGDSGEPTELSWRLPRGFQAGPIQWPAPEAIPFDILVNYGYSGEVLFPIEIAAPVNLRPGSEAVLTADAYWLVCSDICIPEQATLALHVPVAAQGRDDPPWAARIAAAVADLPRRDPGIVAHITTGAPARLSIALAGAAEIADARFFAFDRDAVQAAAPQGQRAGPLGLSFALTAGAAHNLGEVPLQGVVTYVRRDGARKAIEIAAIPGPPLAGTDARAAVVSAFGPDAPAMGALALVAAMGLAFLGGLVLNIMPCVLPVLSVKALSFAGGAHAGQARRHGALYLAGVLAAFLTLAGLLVALRGAGQAVGWGFQLQSPWVTAGLALLFFAVGLNLLGVFNLSGALQNAGGDLSSRGGDAGAFFTGALAVTAATPCTAPFMAGAIGAALTQSAGMTLLIFFALALGFALPMTALSFAPALQRLIPKPGAWMERAKSVLAFPMFAAAVWLAWVFAEQAGPMGVAALLSVAAALAFALFVGKWGRVWLFAGIVALALTTAFAWRPLLGLQTQAVLAAEAWSPARVAQLRRERRAVLVNFTAAWCVTCKLNEATSLARPAVARAFAQADIAYLKADWTNRDATIAAALAAHGRAGVPLYLYYPGDGRDPIVLPQILSEALILETIAGDVE